MCECHSLNDKNKSDSKQDIESERDVRKKNLNQSHYELYYLFVCFTAAIQNHCYPYSCSIFLLVFCLKTFSIFSSGIDHHEKANKKKINAKSCREELRLNDVRFL